MATKKTAPRAPKASPFSRVGEDGAPSAKASPAPLSTLPSAQEVTLAIELRGAHARIAELESRLAAEQEGRRKDIERIQDKLLREMADLKATIARLEERGKPSA